MLVGLFVARVARDSVIQLEARVADVDDDDVGAHADAHVVQHLQY